MEDFIYWATILAKVLLIKEGFLLGRNLLTTYLATKTAGNMHDALMTKIKEAKIIEDEVKQ